MSKFIIGLIIGTILGVVIYHFIKSCLRKSNLDLKVKTCRIGNKFYSVRTIKQVHLPYWEIYHLNTQVDDLKYSVKVIVDKIILYRLEDFYDTSDVVQRNVDAFCDNIMELSIICSECGRLAVDNKILDNAVNQVWVDNYKILHNLKEFSSMLDEYVKFHDGSLFNTHSKDAEINFDKLEELRQAKREREAAESAKERDYLKGYDSENYFDLVDSEEVES